MSLAKGVSANVLGGISPMVVTLVTTPIYLKTIGLERFGILSLVWLLFGYLGIFDLGCGRAVASRVAATTDEKRRADIVWTGLLLSTCGGALGSLLIFSIGKLSLHHFVNIPSGMMSEVESILPLLAAMLPIVTGSSVFSGTLQGRQQFVWLNLSQTAGMVLFQVLPLLAAVLISPELMVLLIAAFIGRIAGLLLQAYLCVRLTPKIGMPNVTKADVKLLLGYGGWVMASGTLGQLLLTMDRFIIASTLNVQAIAIYSLPYNVIIRATLIPFSWFSVLFPRFAAADAAGARKLLGWGSRMMALAVTPITVAGIVIVKPFLDIWLGREIGGQAGPIGVALFVGFWFYAMTFVPLAHFQARSRPNVPAIAYSAELICYVPLLWYATNTFGLIGAAFAWSLRVLVDGWLLFCVAGQQAEFYRAVLIGLPWLTASALFEFCIVGRWYYIFGKFFIVFCCCGVSWLLLDKPQRQYAIELIRRKLSIP
jgi:O-antigen/teichoic acid export membrane protein